MPDSGKPGGPRRGTARVGRAFLFLLVFGIAFGAGTAYAAWTLVCRSGACPSIQVLEDFTPHQTSKLYAVDGRFIAEIGQERRTLVKLSDIPKVVCDAFITTEDKRFYEHSGIDWIRVPGALLRNIRSRSFAQGFSTITMQLAGNIFPERISRREKSVTRKLKEAKVAREIEAKYSKAKILELYLNQIYLGNGAYGVETAAQRYFGKSVRDLNLAEAATLAALPKGPERYNPRRYPERAIQRRNTVIELMRRAGVVSDADARLAQAYPLRLGRKEESGDLAPYFVEWARQALDDQFGQRLYRDGLKVYTTLDVDMQLAAERALGAQLRAIENGKYGRFPHVTYEQYVAQGATGERDASAPNSPYLQGAFIALDPRTGAIRAMIGGRDFDDSKFNRATQALRQPGSTFKPIVYSDAIHNGRPPSLLLEDSPLAIPLPEGGDYEPQNYDGKFEGTIPLRRALYESRNVATVRLGMDLSAPSVIEMARQFGITTPIPPYPSIFLGAADVYPMEMVSAYTSFATLGTRVAPYGITRVENASGGVLWEATPVRSPVLSTEEAWLMVDMMKDVVRRGTAAGIWASGFHVPAAGKTGTTNDGTDVWFVGYTPDLVAGVWMGFDRPQKIQANAQGGRLAAPAWTAFMTETYQHRPTPPDWTRPAGVTSREIDRTTALLRNPYCPPDVVVTEYFIAGTEPTRECDVHTPFTLAAPADSTGITPPGGAAPPGTPAPRAAAPGTPGAARRDTTRPPPANPLKAPVPNPFKIPPR